MSADGDKAVDGIYRVLVRPDADVEVLVKALRDQEAEIAGLRADLSDADERAAMRNRERTEAVMRAKKADWLLRECAAFMECHGIDCRNIGENLSLAEKITAHLGGEQ
jgi:hypothetical protein